MKNESNIEENMVSNELVKLTRASEGCLHLSFLLKVAVFILVTAYVYTVHMCTCISVVKIIALQTDKSEHCG